MKQNFTHSGRKAVAIALLGLTIAGSANARNKKAVPVEPQPVVQPEIQLANRLDSVAYAYGTMFGTQYSNFQDKDVVVPGETMNVELFLAAFNKAMRRDSTLLMTPEVAQGLLQDFQETMTARMQEQHDRELQENKQKGADYMAANAQKPNVKTTESGLQIEEVTPGTGASPVDDDEVLINYVGKLIDGTVFDQNDSVQFTVSGFVPGFTEGLEQMKEGEKAILTIPSSLGYGDTGAGGVIPGGAVIVFEVDLLKVIKAGALSD